jgi:glutamyl-tRNA synthetase
MNLPYRGRLAPSPTGYLHLGHARTFWIAQERSAAQGGTLILRNEDLDRARCRAEFVEAMLEDLRWFGLRWSEGPDLGGASAPYSQSDRMPHYIAAFEWLRQLGAIYPCFCSRQDILQAVNAPHAGDDEPIYPGICRPGRESAGLAVPPERSEEPPVSRIGLNPRFSALDPQHPRAGVAWRFRVSDGEEISFEDGLLGSQRLTAGRDFGDFVVWRKDDIPAYQLACVVDDAAMQITEAVRGSDLITSTFRQLLLYRALGFQAPAFYHCELVVDAHGQRLAKRDDALSLRTLREAGHSPQALRGSWSF